MFNKRIILASFCFLFIIACAPESDLSTQCGNGYFTIYAQNGDEEPYEEECDDGNDID